METAKMAKITGIISAGVIGIAVALGGCEYTEQKLATVLGDEGAKIVLDTGCTGGADFLLSLIHI